MRKPARTKTKTKATIQTRKLTQARESLETIYERLSARLSRYAPPFRFQNLGAKNKKNVQLVVLKPVAIPGAYGGKPVTCSSWPRFGRRGAWDFI